MQFKTAEDIDAPIDVVWRHFTEFSGFEAEVQGRGAELTRVGNWKTAQEGVEWRGAVTIRGKRRAVSSKVTKLVEQDVCVIESRIGGMDCTYEMSFVALSPEVTRSALVLQLSASSLTARLLLQTLKLARVKVMQRMQGILARQGNAIEAEYRRQRNQARG